MNSNTLDKILLYSAIFFVAADIVMALCLGLVLPYHVTRPGWFPASGQKVEYQLASHYYCSCIAAIYNFGSKHPAYIQYNKADYAKGKDEPPVDTKQADYDDEDEDDAPKRNTSMLPYLNSSSIQDDYKFIVSMSYHCKEEHEYLCAGLILKKTEAIFHETCYDPSLPRPCFVIRSQSDYWTIGGQEHKVKDSKKSNLNSVTITVDPPFPDHIVKRDPPFTLGGPNRTDEAAIGFKWYPNFNTTKTEQLFNYAGAGKCRKKEKGYDGLAYGPYISKCGRIGSLVWSIKSMCDGEGMRAGGPLNFKNGRPCKK